MVSDKKANNIFLRMHPLQRILASVIFSVAIYFFIPKDNSPLIVIMTIWIAFALSYLISGWTVLFTRTITQIKESARKDDGSKPFVFSMILISSFASILVVLLLMISKSTDETIEHSMFLFVSIAGMLLSWVMVHTTFTFHYAHMYYDDAEDDSKQDAEGLEFPGDKNPDYLDFAYFAFVIGCTFQVSDVQISARDIRRFALVHQLISFWLNTFVVALTINLVAGLVK